ncbi:MAG: hypothetical protein JWQ96_2541 [Segetibacter sp.]|nr:hypothetical protein [Segetibacter sp.]
MNQSLERSLHYLAGNGEIAEVDKKDLEKVCKEYPYFSVGHILLAKKLKTDNEPAFDEHIKKTILFSSNPHWLHYQLSGPVENPELTLYQEQTIENSAAGHGSTPETSDYGAGVQKRNEELPIAENTSEEENLTSPEEFTRHDETAVTLPEELDNVVHDVPITTAFSIEELVESDQLARETLQEGAELPAVTQEDLYLENLQPLKAEGREEEMLTLPEELDNVVHDVPITTEFSIDELMESDQLARETLQEGGDAETTPFVTTATEPEEELEPDDLRQDLEGYNSSTQEQFANEGSLPEEQLPAENPRQADEEAAALARPDTDEVTEAFLEEAVQEEEIKQSGEDEADNTDEVISETPVAEELDEHDRMFQNIKAMLDATSEDMNAPASGSIIPMDPYHTIDYFASQGIKLQFEANPKDELGKNLKKFTQWLKHMKKLGPEDALETIESRQAEANIQHIADSSNTVREVVTEAMAQVLEKQGKKEKAIQLYIKLSFLNPDKSAYFADKIKNLKGI